MKTTLQIFELGNRVKSNVKVSEKKYKIIGLKCLPEELPESLYFALESSITFKIPYIPDQNLIIENSLQNSISLISKILSYFEIEEVSNEEILTRPEQSNEFNIFVNNSSTNKFFEPNREIWFRQIFKKIDNLIKSLEKDYKLEKNTQSFAYFKKKISKGDIEKYNEFKNNNLIDEMIRLFLKNKISLKGRSKKKSEDSFPNSLKKIFIEILDSYDIIVDDFKKNHMSFEIKYSSNGDIFTNILKKILVSSMDTQSDDSLDGVVTVIFDNDSEFANCKNIYDILNKQFDKNMKYDLANIDVYNKVAKLFKNKECKLHLSGLSSSYMFEESKLGYDYKNNLLLEKIDELFKNVELFNYKNFEEDIQTMHFVREVIYDSINNLYSSLIIDQNFRITRIENYTDVALFQREKDLNVEQIASRYKDMINLEWSDELIRSVRFSTKDIEDGIRHRYFFTSVTGQPFLDQKNLVVDTMLPQSLFSANMDLEKTNRQFQSSRNLNTKTAYAISPLTASAYGCKQIPIEHLCRVLGYTKENIKTMMSTVKSRDFKFVFVGAGGTGNNTAIWLSRMLDMCNLPFLFEDVYVFEKEGAEIHNLLRFPKDPYTITLDTGIFDDMVSSNTEKNKCHIIASELRSLSKNFPFCYEKYIAYNEKISTAYPSSIFSTENITEEVKNNEGEVIDFQTKSIRKPRPNTVFYGAPDIITRQNLSNVGNFISATHASNGCNIYINPEQDAMIQVESYGMIQLTPFFMNQLRMAIGLLEILSANNTYELLGMKDHEFLAYEFDGESKLKNDRVYNFKIISNPEMATENQAATTALDF